jgi:glycerate 2-kinase
VVSALASPASLKGVLAAPEAAAALAEGFRAGGADAHELPVADGGGGTAAVLAAALGGDWHETEVVGPLRDPVSARWLMLPDGTAVVESAQAIGLALVPEPERDPLSASSRGLGELIHAALDEGPAELLICVGDTATVDGGKGLMELHGGFPVPAVAVCDVLIPLLGPRGAARAFGPQKGATPDEVEELEIWLAGRRRLAPFADLPGAGAGGGLGAALASLGAEIVSGAEFVLPRVGFPQAAVQADLVVTGEGTVDATTLDGKAPAAVARLCADAGVRCVVFGGRVEEELPGAEMVELPGGPERAHEDLVRLGETLSAIEAA